MTPIPQIGPESGKQIPPQAQKDIARFWTYVNKDAPGGCWLWTGAVHYIGYGHFWGGGKCHRVHRYALAILGYELVPRQSVDHLCNNRLCVNPAHLENKVHRLNTLRGNCPHAINARKTHCPKGHEYSPENTAIVKGQNHGRPQAQRCCLTCWPTRWTWAIVERAPPKGSRRKWRGPFKYELMDSLGEST